MEHPVGLINLHGRGGARPPSRLRSRGCPFPSLRGDPEGARPRLCPEYLPAEYLPCRPGPERSLRGPLLSAGPGDTWHFSGAGAAFPSMILS